MKKIIYFVSFIGLAISINSNATTVCEDHYGSLHCGPGTVKNIKFRGFVDMSGTHVVEAFIVRGNVDIKDAQLPTVDIRGGSYIYNSTVNGSLKIIGNVTAKDLQVVSNAKLTGNVYGNHIRFNGV